jgi:hypothetical protein
MKKLLLALVWLGLATSTLILALGSHWHLNQLRQTTIRPLLAYDQPVVPEILGAFTFSVKSADAVPEIIKDYLRRYRSPLLPYADFLINTAINYGLDPRLLVAIAQQESNLCKKAPEGSFNCWGWGIHSRGTLTFSSYPEGIEAVAKGLAQNYLGKGLTTPQEIMSVYTPLSAGSWAKGVQQFLDEMQ